jgi:hypothetical protein
MDIVKTERQPSDGEVLAGLVERVTYQNAENGFCVIRVKARGRRDLVTVVGHAAVISAGEWITASGDWTNDRTHGQHSRHSSSRPLPRPGSLCDPFHIRQASFVKQFPRYSVRGVLNMAGAKGENTASGQRTDGTSEGKMDLKTLGLIMSIMTALVGFASAGGAVIFSGIRTQDAVADLERRQKALHDKSTADIDTLRTDIKGLSVQLGKADLTGIGVQLGKLETDIESAHLACSARWRNPRSVSIYNVGVTGLTKNLAGELAPSGISVVVCVLALASARWAPAHSSLVRWGTA